MKNKLFSHELNIFLCFLLVFSLLLVSCGGEEETSDVSEEIKTPELTADEAVKLLENDAEITDIFVNNSLASGKTKPAYTPVSGTKYYFFSEIEALLDSTYLKTSEAKSFYLAYPFKDTPSVKNVDGISNVFPHLGSSFDDKAVLSSVEVEKTDDLTVCFIKTVTESGIKFNLKAVYDEKWLLEKGVYLSMPRSDDHYGKRFENSNLGSFINFSGKILVIEFFISDAEDKFDDAAEDAYHGKIEKAFDFLKAASDSFGGDASIDYKRIYYETSATFSARDLDFDLLITKTGFGDLMTFAEQNYDLDEYDNYVFAVCMNKDPVSDPTFASRYEETPSTEAYFAERVCLTNASDENEICSSLLWLLGVPDMIEDTVGKDLASLYETYFPKDFTLIKNVAVSELSPLTAYACGMTDDLKPIYRVFVENIREGE